MYRDTKANGAHALRNKSVPDEYRKHGFLAAS
jgi:hypothetical protein